MDPLSTSTQTELDDSQPGVSADGTGDIDEGDDVITEIEARKTTLLNLLPLGNAVEITYFGNLLETNETCEEPDIAFVSTSIKLRNGIVSDSRSR